MKNATRKARAVLDDPERKPILQMMAEAIQCGLVAGGIPAHYFTRFLYRKGAPDHRAFLSNRMQRRIQEGSHSRSVVSFFENKLLFDLHFRGTTVRTPPVLGYVLERALYLEGAPPLRVADPEQLRSRLWQLLGDLQVPSVFVKPVDGIQGRDCHLLTEELLRSRSFPGVARRILEGGFIVQRTLQQHPTIAAIYAGGLNTIRMDTVWSHAADAPELLSATCRFGGGGSHVDNISAGGCFVPVELEAGTLGARGFNLLEHGGQVFDRHPTTGVPFSGVRIPHFEEAKKMVLSAAAILPASIVGWDVAIAADGPVLIEGNHNYALRMSELTYGGYRKHPAIRDLIARGGR